MSTLHFAIVKKRSSPAADMHPAFDNKVGKDFFNLHFHSADMHPTLENKVGKDFFKLHFHSADMHPTLENKVGKDLKTK